MQTALQVFCQAFFTIFFAELGDKTQLATLSMAGAEQHRWSIFLGSALALVTTSAIAVLMGEWVGRLISPLLLKRLAGLVFITLGTVYLWQSRV